MTLLLIDGGRVRAVEMRISAGDYPIMIVFLEWAACAPMRVDS